MLWRPARVTRAIILLAGLIATQFILFGPSLLGRKILLPLDLLTWPCCYLSPTQAAKMGLPFDLSLTDPVFLYEMQRRFAVSEIRAGRFPLWDPHEYCGAPFLAASTSSVLSPFRLLDYLWPGPFVIAWDQLLKALLAGTGAYLFFRIVLASRFTSAVIGAWLWPLCGFYIQWAGHTPSAAAVWLPWLFLFTDGAIRKPRQPWAVGLAIATALSLLSGHPETAGQELLACSIFFIWRIFHLFGWREIRSPAAMRSAAAVVFGWTLGILLSAPQTWPTLEYLRTSDRNFLRAGAAVHSQSLTAGFKALPQLVLPDFNGATRLGRYYFGPSPNLPESASTGYVGLLTALVLAPLALCSRRHRSLVMFFLVLGWLGLGRILVLPPLKQIYGSFPLNRMPENRLVFFTGWAILNCAVIGIEELQDPQFRWSRWFWLAATLPVGLGIWCLDRASHNPESWQRFVRTTTPEHAQQTLNWLHSVYLGGFALCMLAVLIWLAIRRGLFRYPWFVWTVGFLAIAEAIFMGFNIYPQADPALYFPRQPILEYLAKAPPGRVCAVQCLPACLPEVYGLRDVRGYDGIDPARLVELCLLTKPDLMQDPANEGTRLQNYFPLEFPSPITRLMNLRYVIFPNSPPAGRHPLFATEGYWLVENSNCLPRVFVPRHVEVQSDPQRRLQLLGRADFDPQNVAYVESPLPPFTAPIQGTARIADEVPSHVTIDYDLKTPGMVVLSDLWDSGWIARVNGALAPVLRADHAFRGVVVPEGKGVLQFDYEPISFYAGIWIAIAAGVALAIWAGMSCRRNN